MTQCWKATHWLTSLKVKLSSPSKILFMSGFFPCEVVTKAMSKFSKLLRSTQEHNHHLISERKHFIRKQLGIYHPLTFSCTFPQWLRNHLKHCCTNSVPAWLLASLMVKVSCQLSLLLSIKLIPIRHHLLSRNNQTQITFSVDCWWQS